MASSVDVSGFADAHWHAGLAMQVNLDFENEVDMVEKMRIGIALQPVATALFANSPFRDGKDTGELHTLPLAKCQCNRGERVVLLGFRHQYMSLCWAECVAGFVHILGSAWRSPVCFAMNMLLNAILLAPIRLCFPW